MNGHKVDQLFEHPEKLDEAQLASLKQAVNDFPYSGVLQALYMKALQRSESYLLPAQIKRAAISVPDRSLLKEWYNAELVTKKETSAPKPITFDVGALDVKKPKKPEVTPLEVVETKLAMPEEVAVEVTEPKKEVTVQAEPKRDPNDISHLPEMVQKAILRSRNLRTEEPLAPAKEEVEVQDDEVVKELDESASSQEKQTLPEIIHEVDEPFEVDLEPAPLTNEVVKAEVPEEREMPFSGKATFLDWLNATEAPETISRSTKGTEEVHLKIQEPAHKRKEVGEIIAELPKFESSRKTATINVFSMVADEKGKFVTETLAEIYLNQGLLSKAISAYEVLSLKYPEKSSFFADRIRDIKKQLK